MPSDAKKRATRLTVVLLGILAGQFILYGASFAGTKILLPLDVLTRPNTYIPLKPESGAAETHNKALSDPVIEDEPARIFRHAELRAGRLPIWNPYQYAGVPSISFLSPFEIFGASVSSPLILPWLSLCLALVSGFGMYVFARRVLGVGAWPATMAAWCFPVTGFPVFWQSSSLPYPIVWLPWLLWAIHAVISRPVRWALPALAVITMLILISGHVDMSALVLIVGGLFAIWKCFCGVDLYAGQRKTIRRFAIVMTGLALGFMLASPELLPSIEYTKTGSRFARRQQGYEERPPIGLLCLPQLVLPHIYGTVEKDSLPLFPPKEFNLVETPAAGFTGLIATLVLAPLALGSRRRRPLVIFLIGIAFVGMAWCLNVPGITWLMRLPAINVLSYNRFVFATSFAILGLATIGLDDWSKELRWHWCYYIPVGLIAVITVWCSYRIFAPPPEISITLRQTVAAGASMDWVHDMEGFARVEHWFLKMYRSSAAICLLAIAIWAAIRLKNGVPRTFPLSVGLLTFGELLFFGYGRAAQCDPQLYYPSLPALNEISGSPPGRTIGYDCFPPALLQARGFYDVRGYDGVDPARMVDLLELAAAPDSVRLGYPAAQLPIPRIIGFHPPDGVELSPILDLLGVRYVIVPQQNDTKYVVLTNHSALPRVFVPRSVEVEPDRFSRLAKLASPWFDPRHVAYVEQPVAVESPVEGQAEIVSENPQRITIKARVDRPGMVVLADQWNAGWQADIEGRPVPILRVDHALRAVVAPAGETTITFRYLPRSLKIGLGAALAALIFLTTDLFLRRHRNDQALPEELSQS